MKLTGFHLEPTNRCVLGCSACERTVFQKKFGQKNWHNQDLDLTALIKFMDIDVQGLSWELCGNTGDPIYYNQLAELISWIKSQQGNITLTTNGSYRDQHWWRNMLRELTAADTIQFSVDGLPDSSVRYRVNSSWPSIDLGMRMASESAAQVVWKMVPFEFNEHEIPAVQELADSRGMTVRLDPSNRFGDQDPLQPRNSNLIWHRGTTQMQPKCATGNEHYISSDGHYFPCCYMAHHMYRYKSEFQKKHAQFSISTTTLSEVLKQLGAYDEQMRLDPQPVCSYTCRL